MKKLTTEEFISKAKIIHGDKYNYSKVKYIKSGIEVCIICPEHGEFWQKPSSHLQGHGCYDCAAINRNSDNIKRRNNSKNNFILKSNNVHNSKYDYSKFTYISEKINGEIICHELDKYGNEHGIFLQTPDAHLHGQGCPKCKANKINLQRHETAKEQFINKANIIHNWKYRYYKNYIDSQTKILINCPIHGDFEQSPNSHLMGFGCQKCGRQTSLQEDYIIKLIQLETQHRNREILNGKEIDIYVPSLKLGIEYNGLRWHSEKFGKDRHYHIDKLNECNEKGVSLIQIFEDEWINHREICESKLKHICGLETDKPKVFARKCSIQEITNKVAKGFLDKNHIQGFASSTVYLGCFNGEQLIGVMSFKCEKVGYWDLNRFATDINYNCVGVGGKLFKYFIKHYEYEQIKSFADRRWTINPNNNLYTKIGFEFIEFTSPDYRYFKDGIYERYHKFGFRKHILNKRHGLPLTMTEDEMTKELGYTRIWDCGLIKYIYKKH